VSCIFGVLIGSNVVVVLLVIHAFIIQTM